LKAVLCYEYGPPECLRVDDIPNPVCSHPQSVRIKVHAAGVNFPDILNVAGQYQTKLPLPFCPGLEVAGEVMEVGSDVSSISVGQRVTARTGGAGGFAEQVVTHEDLVCEIPDSMTFAQGAAFPVTYGTAYHALVDRARLQACEWVLIHGAGGGVGLSAVEIANALGGKVIAAAGSTEKLSVALEHGAREVINYLEVPRFRDIVKGITKTDGADVIFDPVGGDIFDESLRCINWRGRILAVGFATGRIPQCPVNMILLKGCDVMGIFMGAFSAREPLKNKENLRTLLHLVERRILQPYVSKIFSINEVPNAMRSLMTRTVVGKVVIQMN
jgi:NADPH:quinone reductase